MTLDSLIAFVREWRTAHALGSKDELVSALSERFVLEKRGALLVGSAFAIRISQSRADTGFSNAIVAIKKIVEHDDKPVVVCLVSPNRCQLQLANTTFLRKVSHSSDGLTDQNLVGSILGSDIVTEHDGLRNAAENLHLLWKHHQRADHVAHWRRIVAATEMMDAPTKPWHPSPLEMERLIAAPEIAHRVGRTAEYSRLAERLDTTVQNKRAAILTAARDENAKTRGDNIEQLVTGAKKGQGLGDLKELVLTTTVFIDVKSKRLDLSSAPKAYNVDKFLKSLAQGDQLLAILFVVVDPDRDLLLTRLVSVLDRTLIAASRVEARWSGRGSRGTVQLSGRIDALWRVDFAEMIDIQVAREFLRRLLDPGGSTEGQ